MEVHWRCPEHLAPAHGTGLHEVVGECGCSFPIVGGVLRFLDDANYAAAFGQQWNHWATTQLDSHTGSSISDRRLREALSLGLFDKLQGLKVLEVGCGSGRFTEILLREKAQVVSVDLSSAVEANAANCPPGPNHVVAQADMMQLPLRERQFDLVLALGVVQHTPSVTQTIAQLFAQVGPGGALVFDNYAWGIQHVLQLKPLYRQAMKRLGPSSRLNATNRLYDRWAPLHRRFSEKSLFRVMLTRVSPIVYFSSEFPELSPEDREAWGRLDTFDSLTDWYKHRITRGRLMRIVEALDGSRIDLEAAGNGWLVRVLRSADA